MPIFRPVYRAMAVLVAIGPASRVQVSDLMRLGLQILMLSCVLNFAPSATAADIYQRLYSSSKIEFDLLKEADPQVLYRHLAEVGGVRSEEASRWLRLAKGESKVREETPPEVRTLRQLQREIEVLERDEQHPFNRSKEKINLVFIGGSLVNLWAAWNHSFADPYRMRFTGHWLKSSRDFIQDFPADYDHYVANFLREMPGPVVLIDSSVYGFSLAFTNRIAVNLLGADRVRALDFIEGVGTSERRELYYKQYEKARAHFAKFPNLEIAPVKIHPEGLDAFMALARFDHGKYARLGADGEPEADFPLAGSALQEDLLRQPFLEVAAKSQGAARGFLRSRIGSLLMMKALHTRLDQLACEQAASL